MPKILQTFILLLHVSLLSFFQSPGQTWPVRIEAENFTAQSGVQTETCPDGTDNVGWVDAGDWMDYTVTIPTSRIYGIRVRMAGWGGNIQIRNSNGDTLTWISFPSTTSNRLYKTFYEDIRLPAGTQTLRIYALDSDWNFNWFEIDTTSLIIRNTFETAADFNDWVRETARPASLIISDSTKRKGLRSARFELKKSDSTINYFVRSELKGGSAGDSVRWYGFSNYLRSDWVNDVLPEAIAQWHEIPDSALGETWRSPPIALRIDNDHYFVKVLWATNPVNTDNTKSGEDTFNLGPVDRGVWNDWVFHIRFSCDNRGILEVWKNGVKVLSRLNLPNCYNDQHLPYFKIGVYKWGWNGWQSYSPEDIRVIYYDELRIGSRYSNYMQVSPSHTAPAGLLLTGK